MSVGLDPFSVGPGGEGVPFEGILYRCSSAVVSGPEGGLRAGPGGVSIGRFGWADPSGVVQNARRSAQDVLGLVVVEYADWRRVFWDEPTQSWKIREGFWLTMLSRARGITSRLRDGANAPFQRVYADPVDGTPCAAYVPGLEITPWATTGPVSAGDLALLTTWNPVST